MTGGEIRAFIAVRPGPGIKEAATHAISRLAGGGEPVKWVEADNLHLTLAFLGNIASESVTAARRALTAAAREESGFTLRTGKLGAFPSSQRPRVLWLGFSAGSQELKHLATAIRWELETAGLGYDPKAFRPHLTLGRVKGDSRGQCWLELDGISVSGEDFVDTVCLFRSVLTSQGPIYTVLHEARLGEGSRTQTSMV
ncbi:MAG: RNA 2',3'-cyclic phosphodiesterase [Bacillota bacterium]